MFKCLFLGTYLYKNTLFQLYHIIFIFLPKFSKDLTLFILCTLIFDRRQVCSDLLFTQKLRWYILLGLLTTQLDIFHSSFYSFRLKMIIQIHINSLVTSQRGMERKIRAWTIPEGEQHFISLFSLPSSPATYCCFSVRDVICLLSGCQSG